MWISNCNCGSNEFLVISEKTYEGEIENGVLECAPENEHIIEIECLKCQGKYTIESFRDISY